MRRVILAAIFLLPFISAKAQNVSKPAPTIIVDSVEISMKAFELFDSNDIKDVRVERKSKYPNGVIYITLKDHNVLLNFLTSKKLSLQDLTTMHLSKEDKGKPIIYLMNGKLLTDTTDVIIMADRYYNVTITKAAETPYFKQAIPNVLIMMVSTVKQMAIRGAEEKDISSLLRNE